MPEEKDLERSSNKIMIQKIIKVSDFNNGDAEKYVSNTISKYLFKEYEDVNNNKSWKGFTSEYIYSFKIKSKDDIKLYDYDKGINELKENTFSSKIFKTTYAFQKDGRSNPIYSDTFILPEINLICIIGNKDSSKKPIQVLFDYLDDNNVDYKEINICHDFILWLLWKLNSNYELPYNLSLESFENLSVGLDVLHNHYEDGTANIKTEGSGNEIPSLPICYGLFTNKYFNQFKGEFKYKDNSFISKIDIVKKEIEGNEVEFSTIHILSSTLKNLHFSEKLNLVLPFIYNLANLIDEWENYNVTDKYPNIEFIDNLFENARIDFEEMQESFIDYRRDYLDKLNV